MFVPVDPRVVLLSQIPRNGVGAEIGVFEGAFSAKLLNATRPSRLHLIDPWRTSEDPGYSQAWYSAQKSSQQDMDRRYEAVCRRFTPQIEKGQVVVHRGASHVAFAALPEDSLDWVYIDGDHTYAGALLDLRLSATRVKPGGLICGNDYTLSGWWKDGVVRAVHEFLHEGQSQFVLKLMVGTEFVIRRVGPQGQQDAKVESPAIAVKRPPDRPHADAAAPSRSSSTRRKSR